MSKVIVDSVTRFYAVRDSVHGDILLFRYPTVVEAIEARNVANSLLKPEDFKTVYYHVVYIEETKVITVVDDTMDFNNKRVRIKGSLNYGMIGIATWRNDKRKVYDVYTTDGRTHLAVVEPENLELV